MSIYEEIKQLHSGANFKIFNTCFQMLRDCVAYRAPAVVFEDVGDTFAYATEFHVTNCPGWRFTIEWNRPDPIQNAACMTGTWYAEYEELPPCSEFDECTLQGSIVILFEDNELHSNIGSLLKTIEFINHEPALAFCRDYLSWDYNYEHHSRAEANHVYGEWLRRRHIAKAAAEEILDAFVDWARTYIPDLVDSLYFYTQPNGQHLVFIAKDSLNNAPAHYLCSFQEMDGWQNFLDAVDAIKARCVKQNVHISVPSILSYVGRYKPRLVCENQAKKVG